MSNFKIFFFSYILEYIIYLLTCVFNLIIILFFSYILEHIIYLLTCVFNLIRIVIRINILTGIKRIRLLELIYSKISKP